MRLDTFVSVCSPSEIMCHSQLPPKASWLKSSVGYFLITTGQEKRDAEE